MKQESKEALKAAWWEGSVSAGLCAVYVLMHTLQSSIVEPGCLSLSPAAVPEVVEWPAMVALAGTIFLCTALVAWGHRHLYPETPRMGLLRSVPLLSASLVCLSLLSACVEQPLREAVLLSGLAGLVWLLCYLGQRRSVRHSLKVAWQLGCVVLMWGFSVGCLCCYGQLLRELIGVLQACAAGIVPLAQCSDALTEESAIAFYILSLLFCCLGGAKGHSPLGFKCYAALWVQVSLIAVCHAAQFILTPGYRFLSPHALLGIIVLTALSRRLTAARKA